MNNVDCTACARATCDRPVGMVYAVWQQLDQAYCQEKALRQGTLFPELDLPMTECDDCPGRCCATACQRQAFVIWELRLYLDTHPRDEQALALFRRLCGRCGCRNYANALIDCDGDCPGWRWTDDPWPWEYTCCDREEDDAHVRV